MISSHGVRSGTPPKSAIASGRRWWGKGLMSEAPEHALLAALDAWSRRLTWSGPLATSTTSDQTGCCNEGRGSYWRADWLVTRSTPTSDLEPRDSLLYAKALALDHRERRHRHGMDSGTGSQCRSMASRKSSRRPAANGLGLEPDRCRKPMPAAEYRGSAHRRPAHGRSRRSRKACWTAAITLLIRMPGPRRPPWTPIVPTPASRAPASSAADPPAPSSSATAAPGAAEQQGHQFGPRRGPQLLISAVR